MSEDTPGIGHNGYDYGADAQTETKEVSEDILTRIRKMAHQQVAAEAEVARLEEELKVAKENARDISEFKLPALFAEVGMTEFTLDDGTKIKVKEDVRASIPKSNPEPAFKYLEEHGHGALIKREIKISFGKGEEAWAKKFLADLAKRKKPVKADNKMTVHPQTLAAWLREALAEGEKVPLETFGAYVFKATKIELPSGEKPKKNTRKSEEDDLF